MKKKLGQYDDALELITECLRKQPQDAIALDILADTYHCMGSDKSAIKAGVQSLRAKDRAAVVVVVRKQLEDGRTVAQQAKVYGTYSDLIHTTALDFTTIDEQDAIYAIASWRFINDTIYRFTIHVQPDPALEPYTFLFKQRLYRDP